MVAFKVGDVVKVTGNDCYEDGRLFRVVGFASNLFGKSLVDVAHYDSTSTGRDTSFYPYELLAATDEDVLNAKRKALYDLVYECRAYQIEAALTDLGDDRRARAATRFLDQFKAALDPDSCEVCYSFACGGAYGGRCDR